jgi:acetyl esterase/lipase
MIMPSARRIRGCLCAVALMLGALPGCRVTDVPFWDRSEYPPGPYEFEQIRGVVYHDGPWMDTYRHQLDVYVPKGLHDFPVVVFVHGGAWMLGDNRSCGLYASVGEFLASQGIGAVLPNYRQSPYVKHPEHVKDVARAFAWTKNHIAEHGGRTDQLFLVGHSAGGHLAALLATNEQYLHAEGCRIADIRGVVCVSGVFRIPEGTVDVFLGGASQLSLRLDEVVPLRGSATADTKPYEPPSPEAADDRRKGLPFTVRLASVVFGDDPQVRKEASPVLYVRPGLPPFLFMNAEKDLPVLPGMAEDIHRLLLLHGNESRHFQIDHRNHNSIMFSAVDPHDPAASAIVDFVRQHAAMLPPNGKTLVGVGPDTR